MYNIISHVIYIMILLPVWIFRRLTGLSRFEGRFHARNSSWDKKVFYISSENLVKVADMRSSQPASIVAGSMLGSS